MFATNPRLCIIGLGYVGLPLAVDFGKKIDTIGFDIHQQRIDELHQGFDRTLEMNSEELRSAWHLRFTSNPNDIHGCDV
jgi:UDP-N-acetyl-D-galactosamine dehydrogenase